MNLHRICTGPVRRALGCHLRLHGDIVGTKCYSTTPQILDSQLNSRRICLAPQTRRYSTEPSRQPKASKREIRTLRVDRLSSVNQPLVDLSQLENGYLTVSRQMLPEMLGEPRLYIKTFYNGRANAASQPFPAGTRGVFYFHHMRGDDIQSQIRFRLCESLADFPNGQDLQRPDGSLWHITLRAMARVPDGTYAQILALLRAEFSIDVDPSLAAHRVISTLDPSKLPSSSQAATDISGLRPILHFDSGSLRVQYKHTTTNKKPFPHNTVGVFYYKQSRTAPTRLGELRFRLCRDVRHFAQGEDLCLPSGPPWCIISLNIYATLGYQHLREHLTKEGLLEETIYPGVSPNPPGTRIMPLRSLSDPFVVDLSAIITSVSLLTDASSASRPVSTSSDTYAPAPIVVNFQNIFRASNFKGPLFNGRAIATLMEYPGSLPITNGPRPKFALRILEFLTPVKRLSLNDVVQLPQEGKLVMARRGKNPSHQPHQPRCISVFPVDSRRIVADWVALAKEDKSQQ